MNKVTVYQFQVYDPNTDTMHKSRRWGTREAIENIVHGVVLGAGNEVDKSAVEPPDSDIPGLTKIGFDPQPRQGFPTQVKV